MTATPARQDVILVGGGIIALTAALALLERGRSVTILEQGELGRGSSWANCGLITPSHAAPLALPGAVAGALGSLFKKDAPVYVKPRLDPALLRWGLAFARRCKPHLVAEAMAAKAAILTLSRRLLEELIVREKLDCEWQPLGLLIVYRHAESVEASRALYEQIAAAGVPFRWVDGAELARLEPALRPGMAGARFFEVDGHLRPDRYVREVARLVRARGGVIEEGCQVVGLAEAADGSAEVTTTRGLFRAGAAVLTAGAWSPRFARQLGLRIPIQPGKGYTVTTARPPIAPRYPLLFEERKVAITPWASGFRVGSTMELAGYDTSLNPTRLAALWRGAHEFLRDAEAAGEREEWYGWRPMTPDDLPLIGRVPGRRALWISAGHNMLGMSMANASAEQLAAELCGEAPPLDPAPFRPDRF
jgi:D-amino-acid dehydrogenase